MEYKLVQTFTQKGLEKDVNDLIFEGWQPQGGITYSAGSYMQAMVRE